jgi:hypothetical protein
MKPVNVKELKVYLLETSNQGLNLFLKRFPELWIQIRYGQMVELNSPFTNNRKLSVFFNEEKNKWFFKETVDGGIFGDMFSFIAHLYKLDFKRDFKKILSIIQKELATYTPPSFNSSKLINKDTGEEIVFLQETEIQSRYLLKKIFSDFGNVFEFKTQLVEYFSINQNNKIVTVCSSNEYSLIALEEIKSRYYIILSSNMEVWEWGLKPDNYYFGLKQAVNIALFTNPPAKENLILCNAILNTVIFLSLGIAAIKIDARSILQNSYFNFIIKSTFRNLILTFSTENLQKNTKFQFFNLDEYLKRDSEFPTFYEHSVYRREDDQFLQPLWELYTYIDNDNVTIEAEEMDVKLIS